MKIRVLVILSVIAVLAAVAWGGRRITNLATLDSPPEIPTTPVRKGPVTIVVAARGELQGGNSEVLTAPMAGTIIKVQVRDGETVQHRQVLAILSAMKMEHSIIAPYDGKVRRVLYHEGEVVKGGSVIVEME